ncbi:zinc finger protein [Saccharopolyspora spinosa]|uniref:Zinc finger protein n=1 Tax=Saccharopolyspora spinosa TaxID=60894 RepID=A0A2N3XU24_SACSN|nr:zinc finger protein [Saccharopolyspora spinosa]PKW14139.1 zinc finger protein [Saccharopolyspora spinosa]
MTPYRPYPFHWVPAEGARHAIADQRPAGGWPEGETITVLCGSEVAADNSELAWLWDTCPDCNAGRTCLAEVPMPPAVSAR